MIIYFICQGVYTKYILKTLNKSITLSKATFYSIVEFFFSGITPSSTGGQPIQIYYMKKDNIPLRKSYITLILNTVFFKLILLILGLLVLVFNNTYLINANTIYKIFFILGILVDVIMISLGLLLVFKKELTENLYKKVMSMYNKLTRKKKKIDIDHVMLKYEEEIDYIKTHKKNVFIAFIITFIQRMSMFSIIYVVYRALGYNSYDYITLVSLQISVQVAMEAVPFPGGVGVSEGMLHNLFVTLFSIKLADVGMLLTRTFTFYIPLIGSGIIILIEFINNKIKKHLTNN